MKTKLLKTPTNSAQSCQRGITMVEIMVALVLSLVLAAGAGQIYLANKQTYRVQDAQSRLQENGRFALDVMTRDLRQAGYVGCNSAVTKLRVIAKAPLISLPLTGTSAPALPTNVVVASPVTGGDNNTAGTYTNPSPAISSTLASNQLTSVVRGTDAFSVQFAESCGGRTTSPMTGVNPTGMIAAGNSCDITVGAGTTAGTPLVISDCSTSHVFRAASDSSQNSLEGTDSDTLGRYPYPIDSEILRYRSYTYYVRLNEAGQPALYRLDNNSATGGNNPMELVEGIENLQVTYGLDVDSDGAANQFVDAPTAVWPQVVAVRLVVTVRTIEDNLASAARSYTFNGSSATDRRLVRTFSATVGLRNRLP
ncbi:PilW family protein [Methyloterricola oryzae]|uniref:PilW family protein n=1 Tax=Methyloterricola oryzae TaxID=1495050 RepID=UPI0005EBB635|nr:PilW family protein [Methyloterricola oryzae]